MLPISRKRLLFTVIVTYADIVIGKFIIIRISIMEIVSYLSYYGLFI